MVVVADVDVAAGRRLAAHLVRTGFHVAHVTRGREVLTLAESGPLAAAVVDTTLEDMSGYSLATLLKALRPAILLVLTTADYRPELELRARELGILYYAHKPVPPRRVGTVLTHAFRRRRSA